MIKTSLFIATPDMPDVDYVHLYKGEIEDNIRKSAEAGFDAVELITPDPDSFDWDRLEKALKQYNLALACINSGRLKSQYGITLIHASETIRQKAVGKFQSIIRVASRFSCYANIGIFRGPALDFKPLSYTRDMFVDILRDLCDYAAQYKVGINFEPTNRFEINFINSTDDGLDVINRVNKGNLGLLLDLFHMNLEDDDLLSKVVYCRNLVKHFHFTDTDRWPAGNSNGLIDFPQLIGILKWIGYDGYLSQNLVRAENADECARRTASYLKEIILDK
jgi:sugar phosphate isomerase/epimerase